MAIFTLEPTKMGVERFVRRRVGLQKRSIGGNSRVHAHDCPREPRAAGHWICTVCCPVFVPPLCDTESIRVSVLGLKLTMARFELNVSV